MGSDGLRMIKNIAIAVLAFPISFVVLWVVLAGLTWFLYSVAFISADLFPIDVAGLYKTPVALAQVAQASWEKVVAHYHQDPQFFAKLVSDDMHRFWTLAAWPWGKWVTVAAVIGAVIFSLSKLSVGIGKRMLIFRRLVTAPLALAIVLPLLAFPLLYLAGVISDQWVASATYSKMAKSLDKANDDQIEALTEKPMADAVLKFETEYGGIVRLGTLAAAALLALFFTEKLVFAGWLPWCYKDIRGPLTFDQKKKK
jgi:hypothetical protein